MLIPSRQRIRPTYDAKINASYLMMSIVSEEGVDTSQMSHLSCHIIQCSLSNCGRSTWWLLQLSLCSQCASVFSFSPFYFSMKDA